MNRIAVVLVGFALSSTSVVAQVATPTMPTKCDVVTVDKSLLDRLDKVYFQGVAKDTTVQARALLSSLAGSGDWKCAESWPDWNKATVSIVFRSTARTKTGEVVRFWARRPYGDHVSGIDHFWEVFVVSDANLQLSSSYSSTYKADPLVEKIPGLIKTFELSALARADLLDTAQLLGAIDEEKKKTKVVISWIPVPHERGSIAIKDKATTIPEACPKDPAQWEAADALAAREGGASACSKQVMASMRKVVVERCKDLAFRKKPVSEQRSVLAKETKKKATEAFQGCDRAPDELEPALATEEKFAGIIAGTPKSVEGSFTYQNEPLRRFGLATIAALVGSAEDDDRVTLSSNNLAADPLDDPLGAIALNIHPKKFDPRSPRPTAAERWRITVGASFSPEFGVIVGGGYGLVRGLSLNVGVGWLSVNTLRDGDALGSPPVDQSNPFDRDFTSITFVGLGYNF